MILLVPRVLLGQFMIILDESLPERCPGLDPPSRHVTVLLFLHGLQHLLYSASVRAGSAVMMESWTDSTADIPELPFPVPLANAETQDTPYWALGA